MSEQSFLPPAGDVSPRTLVVPTAFGSPSVMKTTPGQIISVNEVLFVLRRWWWRCAMLGIPLAVAAAAVVWFTFVPKFEARALLKVEPAKDSLWGPSRYSAGMGQTELEVLKSEITLSKVAAIPEIAAIKEIGQMDVVDWLRKNLRVAYVNQSMLLQISFTAQNADTAAKVANAILDTYRETYLDKSSSENNAVRKSVSDEIEKRIEKIGDHQKTVIGLAKQQYGSEFVDPDGKRVAAPTSQMASLEARYAAAEVEKVVLEGQRKAYEEAIEKHTLVVPAEDLEAALTGHPRYAALQAEYSSAQQARTQLEQRIPRGPRDPRVQQLIDKANQDLRVAEGALQKAKEELRPAIEKELLAIAKVNQDALISKIDASIDDQKILIATLPGLIAKEREKLGKVSGESQELEFARDNVRRNEAILDLLQTKKIEIELVQLPDVLGHRANPPRDPIEAWPLKKCGMASVAAFLLPFGLAFGWEKLLRRIRSAEQLGAEVNLPVLGEVTALPTRWMLPGRRSSERFMRDRVTFEESIESLRLGLTLCPDFQHLQTVVVTSAISQEGKTSVATALALSVARCTQDPTLLIDADMRAPNAHEMFGISLGPGLAEVLEGSVKVDDAIAVKGLSVHVLPAGELKVSPHVAMKDGAFLRLLDELKKKYRYIIIDAPPVLAAAEALLVASSADGALVCTMRDRSRMQQLGTACQRLTHSGARLVGAVISGVPTRDWAQKYGSYGYGYGYGYGTYRRGSENSENQEQGSGSHEIVVAPPSSNQNQGV